MRTRNFVGVMLEKAHGLVLAQWGVVNHCDFTIMMGLVVEHVAETYFTLRLAGFGTFAVSLTCLSDQVEFLHMRDAPLINNILPSGWTQPRARRAFHLNIKPH